MRKESHASGRVEDWPSSTTLLVCAVPAQRAAARDPARAGRDVRPDAAGGGRCHAAAGRRHRSATWSTTSARATDAFRLPRRRCSARPGVGIELNPDLIKEANENVARAGVGDKVSFLNRDLLQTDLRPATVITLCSPPRDEPEADAPAEGAEAWHADGAHSFGMGSEWPPDKVEQVSGKSIFYWVVKMAGSRRNTESHPDVCRGRRPYRDGSGPRLIEPTDALVTVTRACICGSDLWPYQSMPRTGTGRRMGHEFIGIVDDVGADVRTVKRGDLVVAPFAWSDGTCEFCQEGLQTSCLHGGWWGGTELDGGQGEAVRVPQADGTLVVLPVGRDDALMSSLLTLSDVMGTGHHAALAAKVGPGKIVAVVGDGAVGLCGVIAARRLGAERIILLGRHADRIALAKSSARPTSSPARRRSDRPRPRAHERPRRPFRPRVRRPGAAMLTAMSIARAGGAVGRVGVPQEATIPARSRRSSATSPSPAAPPPCAPTSRSCCRMSSKAVFSPAASSTA